MAQRPATELSIFRDFLERAGLPVRPTSVQKREPPEPDVLCQYSDGEWVAFELVEVCNRRNARFMGAAHTAHRLIETAYHELPPAQRRHFDERFIDRPLSFYVRPEASMRALQSILPKLLIELISAEEDEFSYEYSPLSASVQTVVSKVRQGGKHICPGEINFNIGGYFDPSVTLDAVRAKLSKRYEPRGPVELLAYVGALAWGRDPAYRERIMTLVGAQGMGPFRRI